MLDDIFRHECDIFTACIIDNAADYLQELLKLLNCEYIDLSILGDSEKGGAEYVMGAINYGSFDSVSILVPYTKNINSTNEKNK